MITNGMRWDKFLPKMVLLVEPDDSTRHIISLLLRKCNYKVATFSDGLKAWELLNGNPHSIDLILTEMELPSISGFALLSLITGHDVCKNIPVIMMSLYDSVTTVYKCMLKGAADFLVKPVRKNELSNMWQHVWRRQTVTSDCKMLNKEECQAPQKVEAIAENNATSNSSGGYMHKRENIEKESDPQPAAQSSCTKPEMEFDESHMTTEMRWACDAKIGTVNPSKEAIDLIGSFGSFPINHGCNQVDDPSSMLDLSLMSSHPSSSKDEKQRLNQSDASAFSRYINKPKPSGSCQHGQDESESQFSSPKQRMIAVRGSKFDNPGGSLLPPPLFCIQSPNSSDHMEPSLLQANHYYYYYISLPEARNDSQELHNLRIDRAATEETRCNNKTTLEDSGHFSSATYHSASSGFHNDCIGSFTNNSRREASLNKFRMKRKDRCYDKKV